MQNKFKKGISIVLAVLMLIASVPLAGFTGLELPAITVDAGAAISDGDIPEGIIASGICGDNLTWTLDSDGVLTISGTGDMYDYDGRNPWEDNYNELIKTIVLEDGVTSIGECAFWVCDSLTSITIPDSVTSIGPWAFTSCASLTSIAIPDSVTSIGDMAFSSCTSLISITLPENLTSIGDGAFNGCTSLISITLPENLTNIDDFTFMSCKSLTSITIPDSVTNIGAYAFDECNLLANIEVLNPECVIYDDAYTISDTATIYGYENSTAQEYAEKYDRTFVSLGTAPGGNITGGDIPGGNITGGDIPGGIIASGSCGDNLTWTLDSDGVLTIRGTGDMTDYNYSLNDTLPAPWEDYRSIINMAYITDGVTSIGEQAFNSCESLTNITIPDSVTSIGFASFCLCDSLTSVTIPEGVSIIPICAFMECTSLVNIDIADSVEIIEDYAFEWCTSLTNITIPDNVTRVGSFTFNHCTSLESITIPDSVTSIGAYAFDNCSSLASVTILNPACEFDNSPGTISDTATIYGYENSTAQEYAEKYGRTFVSLGTAPGDNITGGDIPGDNITGGDIPTDAGVSLETNWEVDEYDQIALDIFFDDAVDMTSYYFHINYDRNVFGVKRADVISGVDAKTVIKYARGTNYYDYEVNETEDGLVIWGGYFAHELWSSEKWASYGLDVNGEHFHALTVYLTVEDADAFENETIVIDIEGSYDFANQQTSISVYDSIEKTGAGHVWGNGVVTTAPTHTADGERTYTCSHCGATKTEVVSKLGHSYKGTVTAPTCTEQGYTTYTCTCGDSYVADYIEALGHTEEIIPAVAATCTETGLTAGVKCSVCGEILTEQETVSVAAHNLPDVWTVTQNPAIGKAGEECRQCANCDYTETRVIPALTLTVTDREDSGVEFDFADGTFNTDSGDITVIIEKDEEQSAFLLTDYTKVCAWNITFFAEDGSEIQPDATVTVKMPIPDGYNTNSLQLLHIDPTTNESTPVSFTVENGFVIFDAESFSVYVLIDTSAVTENEPSAEPNDPSEDCSHLCHKDGILGFFWKILRFFWKLFKMHPVCECGAAHY